MNGNKEIVNRYIFSWKAMMLGHFFSSCAILHNMCKLDGDNGGWMADALDPRPAAGAQRRRLDDGDQQPPAGVDPDPAGQRRQGQLRRDRVARLFQQ